MDYSSGDDTDVESQPTSEQDINRLLYIYADNEAACGAIQALRDKLYSQPADDTLEHHRSFYRVTTNQYTWVRRTTLIAN